MPLRLLPSFLGLVLTMTGLSGQAPPTVDTSKTGPQVGATVPAFSGTDQFGKPHTLERAREQLLTASGNSQNASSTAKAGASAQAACLDDAATYLTSFR